MQSDGGENKKGCCRDISGRLFKKYFNFLNRFYDITWFGKLFKKYLNFLNRLYDITWFGEVI
jgi:hypothetical protein